MSRALGSDFLFGTATSGYQIEGGATNTDWWRFERQADSPVAEPCGAACDSWNRYDEDLDLVASMGLSAYRFSVEWARVEPARGEIDRDALDHYRRVVAACHERGLVPVVTMHHFTLPLWVTDLGGFEHRDVAHWMGDYAGHVGRALGDEIGVACTINEPNVVALMGYLLGEFPPAATDWTRMSNVNATMRDCHVAVRDALRAGPGDFPIGVTLSMQEYEAVDGADDLVGAFLDEMEARYFASLSRDDDFVGVQCYTKVQIGPDGPAPVVGETTSMGYLYWPQSVEFCLRRAASLTDLPLIVTENGIGTDDDGQRIRYLRDALAGLARTIDDGVDVRGYFQWSLLDNFEWTLGYGPKFGVVAVDRDTMARTPKASAEWFAAAVRGFPTPA
ncbi:MAG: glycoside hydrolase family 1 protein [Acidimicrobiales bacterium]